jgi:4-hydroxybenzoate polyprenyltransferase
MLTSAASSTSAVVAGVSVASVLVAILLFATLVFREYAVLSERDVERYRQAFGAVVGTLAIAFLANLVVQTIALA